MFKLIDVVPRCNEPMMRVNHKTGNNGCKQQESDFCLQWFHGNCFLNG
jgi:hypothetical protein